MEEEDKEDWARSWFRGQRSDELRDGLCVGRLMHKRGKRAFLRLTDE